ncbi:unnamed protein product [Mytilus edulis]|uniref:Methyltransferase FkbM domain-containing protein n=1 Tax=Mytilus edulis TaxID=6550 RepID=A0A8S3TTN2_MYTED|nr:unnamed protein product [Mytilus edulis]
MVNACVSKSLPSMSFVLAGAITSAKETLTERHRKRIVRDKITYGKHKNWAHASETVKVDCLTFRQLMRTVGRNSIDYFSLDVEGAEMHILNSIEWEEINIDVFTIETDQHREEILSFMKQKGYKWIQKLQGCSRSCFDGAAEVFYGTDEAVATHGTKDIIEALCYRRRQCGFTVQSKLLFFMVQTKLLLLMVQKKFEALMYR